MISTDVHMIPSGPTQKQVYLFNSTIRAQHRSGENDQKVLLSVDSFLYLVTSISPHRMPFQDQEDEWVDTVEFIVLGQAPTLPDEDR